MILTTTLNSIRDRKPCCDGWQKLLGHLGKISADDEILPFWVILESNGLNDALWCCRAAPEFDPEWRLFAVWCCRQVQHLMNDPRSIAALDVAEAFANGNATIADLSVAREAAWAAAGAAAGEAAWEAAWAAAWAAAGAAAWAAADAAAGAASRAAAEEAQKTEFFRIIGKGVKQP